MRRFLLIVALAALIVVGPSLTSAQDYNETWSPNAWRVARLNQKDPYFSGGYGVSYDYVRSTYRNIIAVGYTATLNPGTARVAQSEPLCLGPAGWNVATQIGGDSLTETWSAPNGSWIDGGVNNQISRRGFAGDGSWLWPSYATVDDDSCPSSADGIRFDPQYSYNIDATCYGRRNDGGSWAFDCYRTASECAAWENILLFPSRCDVRHLRTTITYRLSSMVGADNGTFSIWPISIYPTGMYGGIYTSGAGDIFKGDDNQWGAGLYFGGIRSFPTRWQVSGETL